MQNNERPCKECSILYGVHEEWCSSYRDPVRPPSTEPAPKPDETLGEWLDRTASKPESEAPPSNGTFAAPKDCNGHHCWHIRPEYDDHLSKVCCECLHAEASTWAADIPKAVQVAIAIVNDSKHSHTTWANYYRSIDAAPDFESREKLGNRRHQEWCIASYDALLKLLTPVGAVPVPVAPQPESEGVSQGELAIALAEKWDERAKEWRKEAAGARSDSDGRDAENDAIVEAEDCASTAALLRSLSRESSDWEKIARDHFTDVQALRDEVAELSRQLEEAIKENAGMRMFWFSPDQLAALRTQLEEARTENERLKEWIQKHAFQAGDGSQMQRRFQGE